MLYVTVRQKNVPKIVISKTAKGKKKSYLCFNKMKEKKVSGGHFRAPALISWLQKYPISFCWG